MDWSLLGAVVLVLAFIPWVVEVGWQVKWQARFLAALPSEIRTALPPHPRRPVLAFLGSLRFQLAFWRYIRHELPSDPPPVIVLKRSLMASLRRELVWSFGALAILGAMLAAGWRPV